MFEEQNLDVRTITVGININDCADPDPQQATRKIYEKVCNIAGDLVSVVGQIDREYGIPIVNTRVAVSPISTVAASGKTDSYILYAQALDRAAQTIGIDYIGGFSALVHKDISTSDDLLIRAIPECLRTCKKVCSSLNLASSQAGINMDAVVRTAEAIQKTAKGGNIDACTKFVVFANIPEDNPFMAGAFHGGGEGDSVVHVGVSGPGAVHQALKDNPQANLSELADIIKRISFQITRVGQLVADQAAERLGLTKGIIDISLAPTPAMQDSIANIIEEIGVELCGAPGSTAALALLNDAIKRGGLMASSRIGGLSGSFLPVSEDSGMARAVAKGAMNIEKLEAMTSVCSVGLDMVVIPGDSSVPTIAGIIADEMAIGVVNHKTTALRLIPAEGKRPGDWVEFGGLLGRAPVIALNKYSSSNFIKRGGRIPAPISSFRN
ncbi:hypothetical protein LSH36_583g01263 [Paralvinella palmiformis]|uniref:Uncharacterized protein n=1 Tax=Paralvinella palmiformis TaxID=53620 RepID=A0AAD9J518_9ANNE|nr:hypothetical protein LSH36_583g01263 [Paralvinella palmiformis]